jgi:hypothetical protein
MLILAPSPPRLVADCRTVIAEAHFLSIPVPNPDE